MDPPTPREDSSFQKKLQRAVSTEGLTSLAQSTFSSLRRYIIPSSAEDGDLASLTKAMQERVNSSFAPKKLDVPKAVAWVSALQAELAALGHQRDNSQSNHADPNAQSLTQIPSILQTPGITASSQAPDSPDDLAQTSRPSSQPFLTTPSESVAAGTNSRPPISGGSGSQSSARRKPAPESAILTALECLKMVYRLGKADAVALFMEHRLFGTMFDLLHTNYASRQVNEAISSTLLAFMAERTSTFSDLVEPIVNIISNAPIETISAFSLVPTMRCFLTVINALKRADLVDVEHSNGAKSKFVELGALPALLALADKMRRVVEAPKDDEAPQVALALGVLCMALLAGLTRSNVPNKEELRKEALTFELWTFYSSNVGKMECTFTYAVDGSQHNHGSFAPGSGSHASKAAAQVGNSPHGSFTAGTTSSAPPILLSRSMASSSDKVHGIVLESVALWAGELVEYITELCTADSFSLGRQSLYAAQDDAAGLSANQTHHIAAMGVASTAAARSKSSVSIDPFEVVRKWELFPLNWDAMVSDSLFIWRMVAVASVCTLTEESTSQMLSAITALDMDAPFTDFIFRAVISNLIILFRASPDNTVSIGKADTFRHIISTMTVKNTVLNFLDIPKPRTTVKLGHQNWPICMALLTVIAHTSPRQAEIATLMTSVTDMALGETSAEDCEIIEHLMQVLASSTYPPKTLWFSSNTACISCPVDKFAGRWYGYTFMAWVNPLCIWQGGSHLVSWSDPSSASSVLVSIVANGRKKCLSVCHMSGKETSVTLLTESTFGDGWTHIALVHNISGFTVFINGQKKLCGNVPFPKEPSRPHRLCFQFGGSDGELGVKPFFGLMTQPQLMDGAVADKEIERLAAAGPGSNSTSIDPQVSIPALLTIDETITGSLALDVAEMRDVSLLKHETLIPDILQEEDVLQWFMSAIYSARDGTNRNSVAILALEMLIAFARLVPTGLQQIYDKGVVLALSREILTWETVPYHLPPVLIGVVQQTAESRRLINHPLSQQVLTFLADIVAQPNCPALTRNQIFRDLSSLLGDENNVKLFKDGPSLMSILSVCQQLQRECIDDFVIFVEKLIKDQTEMDSVFKCLAFEPKIQMLKCDVLRMMYEVGQSDQHLMESIAGVNAVPTLIYMIGDASHQSENLRAYAIRLLALTLVMNRKQRDAFVRCGGFDTFSAAMSQQRGTPCPLKLTTFNFLFKFALGFFQPMEFNKDFLNRQQSAVNTSRPLLQQYPAMNGHLPSLVPQRDNGRRQISMDLASLHSDPDARLNIDDNYNSQSHSNKTELLHPQLLQTIFALLPLAVESQSAASPSVNPTLPTGQPPTAPNTPLMGNTGNNSTTNNTVSFGGTLASMNGGGGASSPYHHRATNSGTNILFNPQPIGNMHRQQSSDYTGTPNVMAQSIDAISECGSGSSTRREEDQFAVVLKVLAFADRVFDIPRNADVILPHNWMEWIWSGTAPFLEGGISIPPAIAQSIENFTRSIIRKIALADLIKPKGNSYIKRAKDLTEMPSMQRMIIEEVLRHYSVNNRLDVLQQAEATNVLRNLDSLLSGIEECISPFPLNLGVEVATALAAITVHNNAWVRTRVKNNTKLLETRDRLSFLMLSSGWKEFKKMPAERIAKTLQINTHDPNATVWLLRSLTEAVTERCVESVETLQSMIQQLQALDVEQKRTLARIIADEEVATVLATPPPPIMSTSEHPNDRTFVQWCIANESKWEATMAKIVKASKSLDENLRSQNERGQREFTARVKARKVEIERKASQMSRSVSDFEKLWAEVEAKRATYLEAVEQAHSRRKERDEKRQSMTGRTTSTHSIAGTETSTKSQL